MRLFLVGYSLTSFCEIFSVGGLPVGSTTRMVSKTTLDISSRHPLFEHYQFHSPCLLANQLFTGLHLSLIIATSWVLLLNSVVWWQITECTTRLSLKMMIIPSAIALLIISGCIALDTGFGWSGYAPWMQSYSPPNRHIALYVLYQLAPLVFIVTFYISNMILVLVLRGIDSTHVAPLPHRASLCVGSGFQLQD